MHTHLHIIIDAYGYVISDTIGQVHSSNGPICKLSQLHIHKFIYVMKESHIKTINLGRGERELVIRPSLHP